MISLARRTGPALVLLGVNFSAQAEAPGRLGGGGDLSISVWRIIGALILCTIVALVAVLAVRRRITGGKGRWWPGPLPRRVRHVEVVETRRLSPHADISLVREGGREYLLLLFAGGSQLLREGPVGAPADHQS
jgi:hypothetical protein